MQKPVLTVVESGLPTYEGDPGYGVIAPAKVPRGIVDEFNAHIRSEIAKWKRLVKEANLELHQ